MKAILIIIFISSLALNLILLLPKSGVQPETDNSDQSRYPYLSKRIFAENQNDILVNFIPLRQAMRDYVEKQKDEIGVYFEYLPSGTSIGVNEKMEVRLASLIKIPVVMAVYKQIEKGVIKKDQVLTLTEKDINKEFGNLWKKGTGSKITVEEAIGASLVQSDNTAAKSLASALNKGAIDEVFDALDIPKDKVGDLVLISPKNYSSILRSLYLSSFLSKKNSNEILALLTKTDFTDKLPAGVDGGIKVAHKIGVFDNPGQETVFNDCGIVYLPNRPYLLCIMVKSQEEAAINYMIIISKMAYGYVAKVNR